MEGSERGQAWRRQCRLRKVRINQDYVNHVPSADATIPHRLTKPNHLEEGDCSSGRPVIVL